MMKNQLAGLMKQAQAMQDNLKRAQDELAQIEVEGQSGAGLVKVTMTCKHDVKRVTIDPSLLADDKDMLEDLVAAAFNDARAPRRGDEPGKDGQAHRRHAAAARHEVAVLISAGRSRVGLQPRRADRRAAPAARRGPRSRRSAWRSTCLQHDRDGALRIATALQSAVASRAPLHALPHLHRGRDLRHLPRRVARRAPAVRGRNSGRPGGAGAHRQLPRPVLRADGPHGAARRRGRRRHRPAPS